MKIENKLSVIIPVYNWDITLLVEALAREIVSGNLHDEIEIVIADDCSSSEYREKNQQEVNKHFFCRYYEQKKRGGRSVVRNFLVKQTKHPFVLMLDADMLPDKENFLSEYRQQITSDQKIICGGYSYKKRILQGKEYDFYFYKGQQTEEISVKERNETPWRYLFTGNVLAHRDVLNTIGFDENFINYGYEDIEWGIRLSCNYPVHHIENTCSHLGLIPKKKAFVRMRSSIPNFLRLKTLHPELFSRTGAAKISRMFSMLPDPFLRGLDKILSGFFNLLHNNFLCHFLFQLDKAVLLAMRPDEEVVSNDS
jgi:glycosyltransferase involved in cell wall biosynthesis